METKSCINSQVLHTPDCWTIKNHQIEKIIGLKNETNNK